MNTTNTRFWFPVKSHGIGWGLPVTWQGWMVLASYLTLVISNSLYFNPEHNFTAWLIGFLSITLTFLFIVWVKGERPLKWR